MTYRVRSFIALLSTAALFVQCSPKVLNGTYCSFPDAGMSFTLSCFAFDETGAFTYQYTSDEIEANQFGEGTYSIKKKNLELSFETVDPIKYAATVNVDVDFNQASETTTRYSFKVLDDQELPLYGAQVVLKDSLNQIVEEDISDEEGLVKLTVSKDQPLARFEVNYVGFEPLSHLIQTVDTDYIIQLALVNTFIEAKQESYSIKQKKNVTKLTSPTKNYQLRRVGNSSF